MKKQDTAAFSLIRCDTEKKMPALAVRAIRAALFFAGLLTAAQGAAGIWTNYGWLWAAAGAAALVWQSVALGLPRRWLRAVLPLLCLICAAAFSRRFLAGAITVSSSACETLTKATGHILLPLAGVGADAALFVAISAALLGTLCAYAVRWSPTVCGLLLTVLSAALLALLRPDSAQVWMAVCPLCAALLLALGWLARQLLSRRVFPALLRRNWRLAGTPILLRSFAVPLQRLTLAAFIYAAAASLPWAIAGVNKFLLTVFELAATFFVCQGLYAAADLTDLLLASCGEEVRTNRTLTTLLNKVYKVLIVVLGVMTMAQESGLPVGSIVASAGLVGLTISLAAQDSAKNLFSGLVILLDRPFSIGDWITVGDVSGEVVDINFRSTKVRALDNSVYILTNSTVSSATINNGTLRNKRLYRFTLGVTYDTSRPQLEQLMTDLTAMLKASPYTYEDSVLVKLSGFGASSIDLLVSAYLRTADMTRFLQMQNDLNLDLMDVMQKNGVDFAFPSTTVYLEKNSES